MPRINILSPHVADLIAAGEVVERPASAVKELAENAVDAGARNITVEFSGGGAELIRVTDDGCGMSAEDAGVAFLRHATSKLADERGLERIDTLGFRGEALAAISSVSRIELRTCEHGAAEGTYMSLEAGDIIEMRPEGAPEGTSISVRGLFFNTPARRKFLKSDRAEGAACLQAALRCALGRPDVSLRCIRDGREEFFTPGDGRAESAVYALLGRETALGMLPVTAGAEGDAVRVHGFTGLPASGRGSRSAQYFFCNGRFIKSQLLQAAVEQAYKGTLLTGKFPSCVIYLEINPAAVDVNVHPAKTEVKFSDERAVFNAVHYAVLGALSEDRPPVPQEEGRREPIRFAHGADAGEAEPRPARDMPRWSLRQSEFAPREARPEQGPPDVKYSRRPPEPEPDYDTGVQSSFDLGAYTAIPTELPAGAPKEPTATAEAAAGPFRLIGEALELYILVQQGGALLIIDKHAAHERMIYDSLMGGDAPVHTQALLAPVTLTPTAECAAALEENAERLAALGFEYEPFGPGTFALRGVPASLSPAEGAAALEEAGEALAEARTPDIASARAELLKTVACKAAIKAGTGSEREELERIAEAVCSGRVRCCPHGRPVAWTLTRKDLDRQFKRIV